MTAETEKQTLTLKPGTVVHVCGWPVELPEGAVVAGDPANIELITRDLYLRRQGSAPGETSETDQ